MSVTREQASACVAKPMDMASVRALVADDLDRVDQTIRESLDSDVVLIRQVAEYIIGNGGKRFRPLMHLLSARAMGYQGNQHIRLAAIIEFIHTATLLHDDVVDESDRRRGQDTANAVWGNAASVLVGDFLYSRSFQMMVEVGSLPVMGLLAETTNTIAEGEVLQLLHLNNPDTTESAYLEVIRCKTAKLFEAATQLAGLITGSSAEETARLGQYGLNLGIVFQLADDILDYTGDSDSLGKNIGDDLAEGKPTLPLLRAIEVANETQRAQLIDVLVGGKAQALDGDALTRVVQTIRRSGAIEYTHGLAMEYSDRAIRCLEEVPATPYRDALVWLVEQSLHRNS